MTAVEFSHGGGVLKHRVTDDILITSRRPQQHRWAEHCKGHPSAKQCSWGPKALHRGSRKLSSSGNTPPPSEGGRQPTCQERPGEQPSLPTLAPLKVANTWRLL